MRESSNHPFITPILFLFSVPPHTVATFCTDPSRKDAAPSGKSVPSIERPTDAHKSSLQQLSERAKHIEIHTTHRILTRFPISPPLYSLTSIERVWICACVCEKQRRSAPIVLRQWQTPSAPQDVQHPAAPSHN